MSSPPPGLGLAAALTFLATAWALFAARKSTFAFLAALLAVAAVGAARASLEDRDYRENALYKYEAEDYVDVSGTLIASPGREPDKDVLFIQVESIHERGQGRTVPGHLRLAVPFTPGTRDRLRFHTGDAIRAAVRLASGEGFRNFGGFSYDEYLRNRGLHRRGSTKSSLLVERAGDQRTKPLLNFVSRVRSALQEELESYFPDKSKKDISPEGAIMEALLLGEDGRMSSETVLSLQETGLYHLFAISGGHIAIITFLLFSLFRLARLPQKVSYSALIVFLIFYTFLVEASPPVLRATLMTLSFLVGRLLWKDVRILNTISSSAFILLLANPFSLFDAGFQLTYGATLAIILFCPPIIKRLPRLPLGVSGMTAMSVSALLGVMPIIARNFNRVTFASLILNYAAIPLVGLIMGLGYVFLPVAAIFPSLATRLAPALKFLVNLFSVLSHLLDKVHILSYRIPTPHGWTVLGYYAFLLLILAKPLFKKQRLAVSGVFALFLGILITFPFPSVSRDLKVTMIDVGQGDALLVECPGRRKILIDGGGLPGSLFDVGERVVSPFLWTKGIKRIDILVLTHPHPDHFGGLAAVARNFAIGEFWDTGLRPEDPAYSAFLRSLPVSVLRRKILGGFRYRLGEVFIEALHPMKTDAVDSESAVNDHSLVLRISLGRTAFLFAGDIGAGAEQEILESTGDLCSQVLKSPHHGSATSSTDIFLERIQPSLILISVGQGNRFGFPAPSVLEKYGRMGARVLRTDLHGAVEISTDGLVLCARTAAPGAPRDRKRKG